jgi:nucleoid-associated protein YgaU
MGLLDALLGSGQGREEQQEFLQRFEQGQPWEGYTDQEVLNRYGTVAGQASAQEYRQAASEAFARMSPEQRIEFGRLLQQRAREQGVDLRNLQQSDINDFQDAQRLAGLTSDVHQQPGLLRSILGTGGAAPGQQAGLLGHPLAKAALAGIAAMAIKKVLGARAAAAGGEAQTTTTAGQARGGSGLAPGTIPSPPSSQETQRAQTEQPATATPRQTAAPTERWHDVVSGDTLSKLAARYYGDGGQWMRIFEANRNILTDPDRIKIGQKLRIP